MLVQDRKKSDTPLDTVEVDEIAAIRERLAQLDAEKAELEAKLASLRAARGAVKRTVPGNSDRLAPPVADAPVTGASPPAAKIALIRSLFRGREDVFPRRWESAKTGKAGYAPACSNEWVRGVCGKPKIKCADCPHRAFLSVTDAVIEGHLRGRHTVGVYPMLADESCWFLAADFDKATWREDAAAYLAACKARGVPAAMERSRSGNGGHVWIFFTEPVPVALARRLGAHLVTEAMEHNPDIGFSSYDRFFPSQDTMPAGGFGNLIALPLQDGPRHSGNSLFVDESFEPYGDQWAFLSTLPRMTLMEVTAIAEEAGRQGRVLGLRLPLDEAGDEEPWAATPSRRRPEAPIAGPLPTRIEAVLADQIYIPRAGLPAGLVNRLIRLAAFQNPEFYSAQAMRLPTFGIPRVIACAELLSHNVILLTGGMGVRQCRAVMQRLAEIPPEEERVLIATGRYIGEGFDDARLDTLFLAMPISWKGTLAQYVGRLHRLHPDKREVLVYDYIDESVPVLARMGEKRIKGYKSLGYSLGMKEETAGARGLG